MLSTYTGQSPTDIRKGDTVQDSKGTYTAESDAYAPDQWGAINVLDDSNRYRTYTEGDKVTITFDELPEYL
jgi:hypothetical protein